VSFEVEFHTNVVFVCGPFEFIVDIPIDSVSPMEGVEEFPTNCKIYVLGLVSNTMPYCVI
jgi:hypothetical protein